MSDSTNNGVETPDASQGNEALPETPAVSPDPEALPPEAIPADGSNRTLVDEEGPF